MRGSVVQGPVTGEGRGRWLVLIQAAPQAGGLQAERAAGGGAWARVQRRAQPVQRATAAIRHLEEGQPLNQRSPPSLPGGWRLYVEPQGSSASWGLEGGFLRPGDGECLSSEGRNG